MYPLLQSSTAQPLVFYMVASSDHISALTGATPTVTIRKPGGSFASPSGAVTEIANGWYQVAGNATDTNTLGPLLLHATATSGDPTDVLFYVVAYDPQSATSLGLSRIDAAVTTRMATFTLPTNFSSLAIDASGRVTVGSIVNGAIAAATFAANALGAVWDELRSGHTTASTFGQGVASVQGNVTGSVASVTGAVGSVTGAVGSVTGAVGSVGSAGISASSFAAGAIDATAFAQGAADKVWSSATRTLTSFGTLVSDIWANATRTLTSGAAPSVASIVNGVWDELKSAHTVANSFGDFLDAKVSTVGGGSLTVGAIAAGVWDLATSGHNIAGTFGAKVQSISGASGSGSQTVTLTSSPAVDGVELWVALTNDPNASRVAQCTTGDTGTCTVNLDPGTYYLFAQHGGYRATGVVFTV